MIKTYKGNVFDVDADWICIPVSSNGMTDYIFQNRFPEAYKVCLEFCSYGFMNSESILTVHNDTDKVSNIKRNILFFNVAENDVISEDIIIASLDKIKSVYKDRHISSLVFPDMVIPQNFNNIVDSIFCDCDDLIVYKMMKS